MQQEAIRLPEFKEVAHQLQQADAFISPSEAHGILSGCLCAGSRMSGKALLEPILGFDLTPTATSRAVLMALYNISSQQLYDADFTFQLLLPIDDAPLIERAHALKEWCQGFVSGLGLAGLTLDKCQSEDVENALHHIIEISKLDVRNLAANEEDERAFIDVAEYVRLAVMSIYMEFASSQNGNTESPNPYFH